MPTVSLYPIQATYMRSGTYANTSYGTVDRLRCGTSSDATSGGYRTLIQFDLSSIPSNNITSATLYLYSIDDGAYSSGISFFVYPCDRSWPTNATFNSYSSAYYSSPECGGVRQSGYNIWYYYDVTSICQSMKSGSLTNYGFMVKQNATTTSVSKCFAKSSPAPYLSVTYVGSNRTLTTVAGAYTSAVTAGGVIEAGTTFTLWVTPGAYTGYNTVFEKWTLSNGAIYYSVPLSMAMPDSDLTVTASCVRTAIQYALTVANNSSPAITAVSKTPNTSTVTYATACNVNCTLSSLTGYITTFSGWTSSNTSILASSANQGYNFNMPAGDITLYANATRVPISYQLSFNANSGTGTMTNQAFQYDTAQTIKANTLTRTGYYLTGWATTPSGTVVYTNQQSVNNLTTVNNTVITLYAVWALQPYTLTIQANDVTYANVSFTPSGQYYYLNPIEVTSVVILKTGYTLVFNNWSSSSGGAFANATALVTTLTAPASNTTVTANWTRTPNTYTVSFDYSVGSGPTPHKTVTFDAAVGTLPVAFEAGYTFLGWATVEQVGYTARAVPTESIFDASTVYTTAANSTVYAWYHEDIRLWTRTSGGPTIEDGASRCLFEKPSYSDGQWLFAGNWDLIDEEYKL